MIDLKKINTEYRDSMLYYMILFVSISLPFSVKFNSIAIIALSVFWLLTLFTTSYVTWKNKWMLLLPLLLFIIYLYGGAISDRPKDGLKDIEQKLSLLIFPLIFSSIPVLTANRLRIILSAFALACFIASLFAFRTGFDFLFAEHRVWAIEKNLLLHRPYFGLYCGVSILILLYLFNNHNRLAYKAIISFLIIWFIAFIAIINAKMAAVSLLVCLFVTFNVYLFQQKKKLLVFGLNTAAFLCSVLMYFKSNTIREVVNTVLSFKTFSYDRFDSMMVDSFNVRLGIWSCSAKVIQSDYTWLTGLGSADVKSALTRCYEAMSLNEQATHQFNAHNQFLESWIGVGFVGVIIYAVVIVVAIYHAVKHKKYLLLGFTVLFLLCSITESLLNSQKGVVLFSMFYSLLSFQLQGSEKNALRD